MTFLPHRNLYFLGLIIIAVGLPISSTLMSVGQMVIAGNWILEGNYKTKLKRFAENKSAWITMLLFVPYLLGIFYTTDINYAINDLRILLPFFILPFIVSSSETIDEKLFRWVLGLFIASVFCGTVVSMLVYYGVVYKPVNDIRDISIFISHIRFSLMICMAIYALCYFLSSLRSLDFILRIGIYLMICWFTGFLVLLESVTGLGILFVALIATAVYRIFRAVSKMERLLCFLLVSGLPLIIFFYLKLQVDRHFTTPPTDYLHTETYTSRGEKYVHDTTMGYLENGQYTWHFIAWLELESAWNRRSTIDFRGKDRRKNYLHYTLMRFLTSKGLHKDADAVNSLSDEEVTAIENGIANVYYLHANPLNIRIHRTLWELDNFRRGNNPDGNSLGQRFVAWKTALACIVKRPFFGAGTGDVMNAMREEYPKVTPKLSELFWIKPHNQFLSVTVAFGLCGSLWFLTILFLPVIIARKMSDYFYGLFLLTAVMSMLTEDTLGTQAGVTFFAFFHCLFLFGRCVPSADVPDDNGVKK